MFGLFESSRSRGVPVELYLFTVTDQVYAYTNTDDAVVYAGVTYTPAPITHDRIVASGSLDRATLTVRLADATPLGVLLRQYPQSGVMSLTLRQGHKGDDEYLVAWAGRVLGAAAGEPGERSLSCQPVTTSLERSGLRRNWQYPCPHVLYGAQCRASLPAATVTAIATGSNGTAALLPSGWHGTKPIDKFMGGLCAWGGEIRTILRTAETGITLSGPASFAAGTELRLSLGCNHQDNDCRTIHVPSDEAAYGGGNIRNYGGDLFIPTQNPIGFVSNY